MNLDIPLFWKEMLAEVKETGSTDIHFTSGNCYIRKSTTVTLHAELGAKYEEAVMFLSGERQKKEMEEDEGASDFAASYEGHRLRCNIYRSLSGYDASFRPLPTETIPWEVQRIPRPIMELCATTKQGLVLVTGPTGSGKSTTLCAMIDYINQLHNYKIITIEDPIEFIFEPKKSIISQREIGTHATTFARALRSSLRQNPDVILVGEIRDYETALTALHAAETGHLVFATLHTKRVANTVSRLVEMAPEKGRDQIRDIIANNVILIICQRLLQKKGGNGIIPCREILKMNTAANSYIRAQRDKSLVNVMNNGRSEGMAEWSSSLKELVEGGEVTREEAKKYEDEEEKALLG